MMSPLTMRFGVRDGACCAYAAGEIDLSNAGELTPDLVLACGPGPHDPDLAAACRPSPRVSHLDLTAVTYMDSTAIHQILRVHRAARERGLDLIVHAMDGSLPARILRMVGMDQLVHVRYEHAPQAEKAEHADHADWESAAP